MQRADDFAKRREHLANLSEEDLDKRFWELANKIVEPLVEMAKVHTSPSIERSVLLRMGISSLEAASLVKRVEELGLLGRGAGHVLWRLSQLHNCSVQEAGEVLMTEAGGQEIKEYFERGAK
jgi:D-ornithine 4,5-aminomutase subunit alpha